MLGEQRDVGVQHARVCLVVLARPELKWVHKDCHYNLAGSGARTVDEFHVACVQRAHGHDHCAVGESTCGIGPLGVLSLLIKFREQSVQFFNGVCDVWHGQPIFRVRVAAALPRAVP